jgi:hypothetical protein
VGLDEQPFWYDGALVVYHMGQNYTRMELHDPGALEPAKGRFSQIASRLQANGGGLISIFYHPCEWVHQEFWDGVNFRRGANPPREQWNPPPQLPSAATAAAFDRFGQYIDHIRSVPGVRFVTAGDLPEVYPDAVRTAGATEDDLRELARRLLAKNAPAANFAVLQDRAYSLADQFELFTSVVGEICDGRRPKFPITTTALLGPDKPPPAHSERALVSWFAFRDATRDVRDFVRSQHRVPARVFFGAYPVSPLDFLVALAAVYVGSDAPSASAGGDVAVGTDLEVVPARKVASDTPGLFGGWIIHKEGFRAPHILEVARLQAWTLKPALRRPD